VLSENCAGEQVVLSGKEMHVDSVVCSCIRYGDWSNRN